VEFFCITRFEYLRGFHQPLTRKFQNTRADIKRKWICNRSTLFYQHHCRLRIISQCDQNRRAHSHPAVTSARAVRVNFASVLNCFQSGSYAAVQRLDRNWNQRESNVGSQSRRKGGVNGSFRGRYSTRMLIISPMPSSRRWS
jgi:hypothetical protein